MKMKDVIISIRGMQNYGDGDDAVEFVTDGQYGYADGCGTLTYMESELTGLEGTRTSLSFDPERMIIEREGTLNARMVFEPGQRHMFLYETPFGAATMAVDTRRVRAARRARRGSGGRLRGRLRPCCRGSQHISHQRARAQQLSGGGE